MYAHTCARTRAFKIFDHSATILQYNARLQALTPGGRFLKIGKFDHHSTTVRPLFDHCSTTDQQSLCFHFDIANTFAKRLKTPLATLENTFVEH